MRGDEHIPQPAASYRKSRALADLVCGSSRTLGGFFTSFGSSAASGIPGNVNCPNGTRAVGFSFLPDDFGMQQLQVC